MTEEVSIFDDAVATGKAYCRPRRLKGTGVQRRKTAGGGTSHPMRLTAVPHTYSETRVVCGVSERDTEYASPLEDSFAGLQERPL